MLKCCDAPKSTKPHKCPHLASFKMSGGLESFSSMQQYLQTSRLGFLKLPRPRCGTCTSYSDRLHACLQCVFFACWNGGHLFSHFKEESHFLGVDVTHNEIYCHQCGDYVYDEQLDDIIHSESNTANQKNLMLLEPNRTQPYHRWTASKDELSNLGKNSNPSPVSKNVLGLRGLINLGNTCFMNCILQSFVHNPLMRNYFLSDRHNNKECRHKLRNVSSSSSSNPSTSTNGTSNTNTSNYSTSNNNNSNNTNSNNNNGKEGSNNTNISMGDKEGTRSDVCLGCEMDILFEQIFSGTKTPYTPHHILHSIWKYSNYFAGYEQQDAHEFLISSLNGLHTHLERTTALRDTLTHHHHPNHSSSSNHTNSNSNTNNNNNNNNSDTASDDGGHHDTNNANGHHSNYHHHHHPSDSTNTNSNSNTNHDSGDQCNCIVHTIFKGTLRSDVTCSSCGFTSVTEDPFIDISLDIPKASSTSNSAATSTSASTSTSTPTPSAALSSDSAAAAPLTTTTTPPMSPPQPPSPSSSPHSPVKTGTKRSVDEMNQQDGFLSPPPTTSPISTQSPIPLSSPIAPGLQSPPPSFSTPLSAAHTLSACLDRFTQPERLGADEKFLCSKCHTRQESIKQLSMKNLPVVICFHLKRFEQLANSRHSNKIDTFISFPSVLDMSPYTYTSLSLSSLSSDLPTSLSHSPTSDTTSSNKIPKRSSTSTSKASDSQDVAGENINETPHDMFQYHLFAVVNHHGKMDTGHYTCFVKHEETWYKCDDATITVTTLPQVLHSKGYLLFYIKQHLQYATENSKGSGSRAGSPSERE